ncbi:MAG: WYL domain-containing protein [Bacteroidota bacterium]
MPLNRNALIRYRTIDRCLQNRYRKWTLEDITEACSEALYEYQGIDKGVSRRTTQADIEMMRSDKLGYEAPIIVTDKKYYTYAEGNYSITNIPLNNHDMEMLSEVSSLLKQFKGFSHFADLELMVTKLEDKIYSRTSASAPIIDFEKNDNLKGLEWLEVIRKAIVAKSSMNIKYKSFKAREESEYGFSAYLLKEYRNRWFVLGRAHQRHAPLLNLALDRIVSVEPHTDNYLLNTEIDLATYYNNCIGVTKSPNQRECEVVFRINRTNAPYIITKPLHHTQKLLDTYEHHMVFSIKVILNYELERELLGFGSMIKVLRPRILIKQIKTHLKTSLAAYLNDDSADKVNSL